MSVVSVANTEDVEVPEGHSIIHILDSTGDSKIIWDPNDEADVAIAKAAFEAAQKKGHRAYKVDRKGEKTSEVVRTFDPKAEKLIMAPAFVGG